MHGLAWMEEALREVEAAANCSGLREIIRVILRRGQLSHHSPEELTLAWDLIKKGTICQEAILVIEEEPALICCRDCGWKVKWDADLWYCQVCGGELNVVSGTDLQLAGIQGI